MDAYVQNNFPGLYYDENAAIALKGKVIKALLHSLNDHSFFKSSFPKTIGPELFNLAYLDQALKNADIHQYTHEDVMATLNLFTAETIAKAIYSAINSAQEYTIYCSGGGMHNPLLMHHLKQLLPNFQFKTTNDLNINPDAKEAVLFAVLANECLSGNGIALGKGQPAITMGKISFPS
jgi:anhydro-N-acetylmuramic acid kinase